MDSTNQKLVALADKLEADLAEARAQIAAKDEQLVIIKQALMEAKAKIAAKDAEIEKIAEYVERAGADEQDLRAQIAAKDARVRVLAVALEYALQKMWEYGFTENDLQPVRNALSIPKPRRLTPEEAGEIADSIEASLKGQDNG